MNSELCRPSTSAVRLSRLRVPLGLALTFLALAACSPPETDESSDVPGEPSMDEAPAEPVAQLSVLEALLDRLGEPVLAENCTTDTTVFRIARLEWDSGAAAVRVFSGPDEDDRGYRSVFSAAPGEAISSDGWLDERTWDSVYTEFQITDFWNIESDQFSDGNHYGGVLFVEACKKGAYHFLEAEPNHHWLDRLVTLLARIGKLQWLETGRRDFG